MTPDESVFCLTEQDQFIGSGLRRFLEAEMGSDAFDRLLGDVACMGPNIGDTAGHRATIRRSSCLAGASGSSSSSLRGSTRSDVSGRRSGNGSSRPSGFEDDDDETSQEVAAQIFEWSGIYRGYGHGRGWTT